MRAEATSFFFSFFALRRRAKKRGEERREWEKNKRERKREDREWVREHRERSRKGGWHARRVEKVDVEAMLQKRTTTTLVIVTLSRLYRNIQSSLLLSREILLAPNTKHGIPWRAAVASLLLVDSRPSFYYVPPSSSVRLDNVQRSDKVSRFQSRRFQTHWYATIISRTRKIALKSSFSFASLV